jgi:hypothetical protein
MISMKRALLVLACSVLFASGAHAQTCTGGLPMTPDSLYVGGNAGFSSDTHEFAGGIGRGFDQFFVHAGGVIDTPSDLDSAKGIFGSAGIERPLKSGSRTLSLCPTVALFKTWGPTPAPDVSISSLLFSVGADVGFNAGTSGQTAIVPTFGFRFNDLHSSWSGGGFDFSGSDTFGTVQFGVGLLFNERTSVTPSVIVAFGADDAQTMFGVVVGYKLGGK